MFSVFLAKLVSINDHLVSLNCRSRTKWWTTLSWNLTGECVLMFSRKSAIQGNVFHLIFLLLGKFSCYFLSFHLVLFGALSCSNLCSKSEKWALSLFWSTELYTSKWQVRSEIAHNQKSNELTSCLFFFLFFFVFFKFGTVVWAINSLNESEMQGFFNVGSVLFLCYVFNLLHFSKNS